MDQRKAEVLLKVLQEGSFRRAAEQLNCTQSAVTQAMDSLERELGCKIVERGYRGARLTAAGERLYPYFVEFYNCGERLMKEASHIAEGKNAPIRIGAFCSIANTWLPQLFLEYQELHPQVSFDVQIGSEAIAEWLLSEKIDIGLADELRGKVLKWTPLLEDHFSAIVPAKLFPEEMTEVTLQELNLYPFVIAPLDRTEHYVNMQPKKFIRVQCENDSVVISMVSREFGVAVLPDSCLWEIPDNVRKLRLLPDHKRIIGMAISDHCSTEVRRFAKFVREKMKTL